MSGCALEHGELPRVRSGIVPENAQLPGHGSHLEVAVIGREPLVDDQVDVERAVAKAEPARRLLTAISGVTVDRDAEDGFVHCRPSTDSENAFVGSSTGYTPAARAMARLAFSDTVRIRVAMRGRRSAPIMMNRRAFLRHGVSAAGIVFVECHVAAGAQRPTPSRQRRPVRIKGRRIRTVDVHAHCAIPAALELLTGRSTRPQPLVLEGESLAQRLSAMDAQGIDVEVLSINPTWYSAERDLAERVIETQNVALAELCSAHSDRFAAFASVALQFPDLAADQLVHAVKQLGLRGVAIGGSVAGRELSDAQFHPFWAKADELGSVVFIHPQLQENDLNGRLKGNGFLGNVIGNPLETTIALSHLIFEGTLDRFPGLKLCAAHGGGYLPSYMSRSDHGCVAFPERCTSGVPKKPPTEYVKQLYYDSLVFTPEGLRHLAAEVGPDHVMLGTDYPFPWVSTPVDHVLETVGLTDRDREAILGGTAARLLGLAPRLS